MHEMKCCKSTVCSATICLQVKQQQSTCHKVLVNILKHITDIKYRY